MAFASNTSLRCINSREEFCITGASISFENPNSDIVKSITSNKILNHFGLALLTLALQVLYGTNPPSNFPQVAFLISLLWIPLLAELALIHPPSAVLVRTPDGKAWRPRGLEAANTLILSLFGFAMSRGMDITAAVSECFAEEYEVYVSAQDRDFSLRTAIIRSVASVAALSLGKWVSSWLLPVLEWLRIVKWDSTSPEKTEVAEDSLDEWQLV